MRLEDIAILSRTPLLDNPALLTAFNSHPDVVIDPKTNLYKFKVHTDPYSLFPSMLTYCVILA